MEKSSFMLSVFLSSIRKNSVIFKDLINLYFGY